MDPDLPPTSSPSSSPGAFRYILGYLLVSLAWGFTTPFIRRAAVTHKPRPPPEFLTHKTSHRTISSSSSSSEEDTSRADGGGGNGNGSGTGSGAGKRPRALPVRYVLSKAWNVYDLVRDWRYALPLACNLLGSVGFFALVGRSELSLTVPITNSGAFLCTVLGEWYVEGRGVGRDTWAGMGFVIAGIAVCVISKGV